MRDPCRNPDRASSHFGADAAEWIELSTGINRVPYPVPPLRPAAWTSLPTRTAMTALLAAARLMAGAVQMDALATEAGWQPVGGTALFRLYERPDAGGAQQERPARQHIWSRVFSGSTRWLRLALPGGVAEWTRFGTALEG